MSEKTFKPAVEGKNLTFIKPSKLAEQKITGTILEGIYVAPVPNSRTGKTDYKFELSNGDLAILNNAGNLDFQMKNVEVGTLVRINYQGKSVIKSGPRAGKEAHSFQVMVEAE